MCLFRVVMLSQCKDLSYKLKFFLDPKASLLLEQICIYSNIHTINSYYTEIYTPKFPQTNNDDTLPCFSRDFLDLQLHTKQQTNAHSDFKQSWD